MRGKDVPVKDDVRLEVGVNDAVCDEVRVNDAVCDRVGVYVLLPVTVAVRVREIVTEGV